MKYIVTLLITLLFSGYSHGQEQASYTFSLQEAVNFAIDSNKTAINARRDIAKAIKQKWETTAIGLPQVNGDIAYQNQLIQATTFFPSEFFGGEPGTFTPIIFSLQQNVSVAATLSQLIFDGSYLVGLQAAKTFLEFSENANEKTKLEVRKGVINAYGGVLIARESVAILDRNLAILKKNLDDTKVIIENGLAEAEDAEQLELTYQQLQNSRNNAYRMQAIALQMFNNALGLDIDTPTALTQSLEELATPALHLLNDNFSVNANVDWKIATNLTEQRSLEVKLEKSKALPTLSGFINLGTQTSSDDFIFLNGATRWFAQSFAGFNLNVPIFSSGQRSARTARANIALEQAQTDLENTIQEIELAFAQAKNEHTFAIETYQNSKSNLALAERIENKNRIKFKEGIGSSFELRQAQTQLYTSQQEVLQSMLSIVTTKAELETVLNTPNYRSSKN